MLWTYNRLCGIPHNRFGGRAGETELPKGGHRALVRSHAANRCVDHVRRTVQNDLIGHRGRKLVPPAPLKNAP